MGGDSNSDLVPNHAETDRMLNSGNTILLNLTALHYLIFELNFR